MYILVKCSRARVDEYGGDSIQFTQKKQNGIDGVRQDAVLVIIEERPFHPDGDVLRKTGIFGTDIKVHPLGKNLKNRMGKIKAIRRTGGKAPGGRKKG